MRKLLSFILLATCFLVNAQTKVAAPIIRNNPSDTYPTHDANLGKGGAMSFMTIGGRDSIPVSQRTAGMLVSIANGKTYKLNADLSTWTALTNGTDTTSGVIDNQTGLYLQYLTDPYFQNNPLAIPNIKKVYSQIGQYLPTYYDGVNPLPTTQDSNIYVNLQPLKTSPWAHISYLMDSKGYAVGTYNAALVRPWNPSGLDRDSGIISINSRRIQRLNNQPQTGLDCNFYIDAVTNQDGSDRNNEIFTFGGAMHNRYNNQPFNPGTIGTCNGFWQGNPTSFISFANPHGADSLLVWHEQSMLASVYEVSSHGNHIIYDTVVPKGVFFRNQTNYVNNFGAVSGCYPVMLPIPSQYKNADSLTVTCISGAPVIVGFGEILARQPYKTFTTSMTAVPGTTVTDKVQNIDEILHMTGVAPGQKTLYVISCINEFNHDRNITVDSVKRSYQILLPKIIASGNGAMVYVPMLFPGFSTDSTDFTAKAAAIIDVCNTYNVRVARGDIQNSTGFTPSPDNPHDINSGYQKEEGFLAYGMSNTQKSFGNIGVGSVVSDGTNISFIKQKDNSVQPVIKYPLDSLASFDVNQFRTATTVLGLDANGRLARYHLNFLDGSNGFLTPTNIPNSSLQNSIFSVNHHGDFLGGNITLNLADIANVSAAGPAIGNFLMWNGSSWTDAPVSGGGGGGSGNLDTSTTLSVTPHSQANYVMGYDNITRKFALYALSGLNGTGGLLRPESIPNSSLQNSIFSVNHHGDFLGGNITLNLGDLNNVVAGGPTTGSVLTYNGSVWTDVAPTTIATPTVTTGSLITGNTTVTGNDREGYVTLTVTASSSLATNSELFSLSFGGSYSGVQPPVYSTMSTSSSTPAGSLVTFAKNVASSGFSIAMVNSATLPAGTYMFSYHTPAK